MSSEKPVPLKVDGEGLRFAIVAARYNKKLVDALLAEATRALVMAGVSPKDVQVVRVPGSHETPYASAMLAATREYDCVIALGVVLAGETSHHQVIADSTAAAFHKIAIDNEVPVINGLIVANSLEEAEVRCSGKLNRGREFGNAALAMAELKLQFVRRLDEIYGTEDDEDEGEDDDPDFLEEDEDDEDEDEGEKNPPWKS